MAAIRLIAFDLDGTALTHDKRLTDRTVRALRRAIEAGAVVVPATGRPLSGVPEELLAIGGIRYVVSSNGAITTDVKTGERLRAACLDRAAAEAIVRLPMERGLIHSAFVDGLGYSEPAFFEMERNLFRGTPSEAYIRRSRRVVQRIGERLDEAAGRVENIWILAADADERRELDGMIRSGWNVKTVLTGEREIEVSHPDADKGVALKALACALGIGREEIFAVGDNENDIGMLRAAGFSVAMGNGTARAKAAAMSVTDTNEKDGAAKAIERALL